MIYVAHAHDATHARDYYKIGRSQNPAKRMWHIRDTFIGARFEPCEHPTLMYSFDAGNDRLTEKALHWLFRGKKVYGEWFALDAQDIDWIATHDEEAIIRAADDEWYRILALPHGKRWRARLYGNWKPTVKPAEPGDRDEKR